MRPGFLLWLNAIEGRKLDKLRAFRSPFNAPRDFPNEK
jgi:hypothetical protein